LTTEEALQELKASIVGQGFQCHPETYKEAISALEKQIPKRLTSRQKNRTRVSGKCPTCGRNFSLESIIYYRQNTKHCPNCGQAIDWSEES